MQACDIQMIHCLETHLTKAQPVQPVETILSLLLVFNTLYMFICSHFGLPAGLIKAHMVPYDHSESKSSLSLLSGIELLSENGFTDSLTVYGCMFSSFGTFGTFLH